MSNNFSRSGTSFRVAIKFLLIAIVLGSSADVYLVRLSELSGASEYAQYFMLFSFFGGLLIATAYIRTTWVRIFWAVLLAASFIFYDACQRVFGEPLYYRTFLSLFSAKGFAGESFSQYFWQIMTATFFGVILFIGLVLPPKTKSNFINLLLPLAPVLGIVTISFLLFLRGGWGAAGVPPAFTTISFYLLMAYENTQEPKVEQTEVTLELTGNTPTHDVVLIIDESIRGDYLDINSSHGAYSGLNTTRTDADILNYHLSVSAGHCSDVSNLYLRFGGTRETFRSNRYSMPSIWQYASNANFKTVYIDNQRINGLLHNKMDKKELSLIDKFIQHHDVPVVMRDVKSAQVLAEHINNGIPEFIFVNKVGGHFPINDKFPDEFATYEPMLSRGKFANISHKNINDPGERVILSAGDWLKYTNSYKNTVTWNIGEFFDRLFENSKLSDAFIVYTADHGQNFHERGDSGFDTHCSFSAVPEEGVVPLVVIQGSNIEFLDLKSNLELNKNGTSHYNIFSTLLRAMNYTGPELAEIYGPSLEEHTKDELTFNYAYRERLGRRDKYRYVDPEKIYDICKPGMWPKHYGGDEQRELKCRPTPQQ